MGVGPMKKVLILITKATSGGAQTYVLSEAKRLQREQRVPIVSYGEEGMLVKELEAAGIETYRISALSRDVTFIRDVTSFFQIYKYIGIARPDEIHLNSSKAAGLGAFAARLRGAPKIIFVVHGWPFKEKRNVLATSALYVASWLTALLSHEVRVVSRSDEELGKRMWGVAKKIRYMPLHIETPKYISRDEAASLLGIDSTLPRIVTVAELTKNKGHQFALDAIAELKRNGRNVQYYMIGEGEERAAIERRAKELGIGNRVHLLGFIQDAAKYLKSFDIFLLPSVKEGMPYALLEAAQSGLPIVTTNVVDPEFLKKNPGIMCVEPENPSAIASAIVRVLQSRD
ncbi:glycosyltransferase [Candidatus Kaiserbacteria bacterium]|nr:glycosyltransferase [Candidatus Kaiserbacteria bacterium]